MKKKIFTGVLSIGVVLGTLPMFMAFEAHVINVTATIENAMSVPIEELEFGTVFPQEKLDKEVTVGLSESFIEACNAPVTTQWASGVVSTNQGKRKNGTAVLPDRSNPTFALGPANTAGTPFDNPVPANSFFALGFSSTTQVNSPGGSITLSFTNFIVNVPGPDITVFEVTGGTVYPDETVDIEASKDGVSWTLLASNAIRDEDIDLGVLDWAKFVRITDTSNRAIFEPTADAFDLDAVRATSREVLCGDVDYMIRQKPKCVDEAGNHPQVGEDGEGNFICPQGSTMMPLLCPYLSKHEITSDPLENENDGPGINAFHGLPGPWTLATAVATQVEGQLSEFIDDISDNWNIDLKVPCFANECAQDWPNFVADANPEANPEDYKANPQDKGKVFGCDLWVEVTALN